MWLNRPKILRLSLASLFLLLTMAMLPDPRYAQPPSPQVVPPSSITLVRNVEITFTGGRTSAPWAVDLPVFLHRRQIVGSSNTQTWGWQEIVNADGPASGDGPWVLRLSLPATYHPRPFGGGSETVAQGMTISEYRFNYGRTWLTVRMPQGQGRYPTVRRTVRLP